ncbi:hypothetical protein ACFPJ4_14790 [Lysinimonas soli]|uniref:Uncharacterized protein n=1 Tax=Lysinimonas soli TaxID=1074233 RepID=A0ABW0NW20_9MICO
MRTRRAPAVVIAAFCCAVLTGCVGSVGGAPSDPRSGGGLAYGLAPQPDKGTTFQADVVLVDGGASSVRSVTADGLTWTLSPSAGGISDLKPGRVMFLTDRGVGRVVAVRTTSAGVAVTIGPVDLTGVIRDGDFASQGAVPITNPVVHSAAGAFWADPELQRQAGVAQGTGADLPAVATRGSASAGLPRPPSPAAIVADTVKATTGSFNLTGSCCGNGPGVSLAYDKNGLSMAGRVALDMERPTADFALKISGGTASAAALTVRGAAGISAKLSATAQPNAAIHGFSPPLGMDFDFSVPVGVFFGVPLNLVVSQRFTMEVNIPGQAHLDAVGKIKLGSSLGFRYADKKFSNTTSASLDTSASLTATNSIAVGISYAAFDYNVRFTVGLGYLGFVAGVYLALGAHVLATVGAPIGFNVAQGAQDPIEHCKSVQGELWADYGVGYTIPTPVATLVNYFLEAFHSTPISTSGGLSHGWTPVFPPKYEVFPQSGFCVKK